MPEQLFYGGVPVPYTVSWRGESRTFIGPCIQTGGRPAICQDVDRGTGKPAFGTPHSQRQREVIRLGLCDLCGLPLKNRTKVSLSHARPHANGAEGMAIMQVEPLLHKECAAISMRHCPSLKRDVRTGAFRVRQVNRYRIQIAIIAPEFIGRFVPGYVARSTERIAGHAKVELLSWKERDVTWLMGECPGE
ncbi:conserved hypothetical protein [Hyphomicrobiales bacterium]|nr:conserved hypothetical protein [Hyphomicrobiales bacterium]CAH1663781.1 conserved hypothetical protein [Hyphomicrobiales bacterium]